MGNFFNFFQKKSKPINSKDISTQKKRSVEKVDSSKSGDIPIGRKVENKIETSIRNCKNISDYEKEVQKNINKILSPKTILEIRDALIFFNTSVASNKSFEKIRLEAIEKINWPLIKLGLNLKSKIPTDPKDQNVLWNQEISPKLPSTWQGKIASFKPDSRENDNFQSELFIS